MERLLVAVQELSLAQELADVQRIVRTAAREILGCDGATFVLRDAGMCFYADEDAVAALWKGGRFPMDTCIGGWSMLHRQPVVIPDVYQDDRIPHAVYRTTFVKSLVMVPIRRLEPVGAIGAYWARERMPSENEVSLLQGLADSTSVAMAHVQTISQLEQRVRDRTAELRKANDEIRRLSLTDELTGLYNLRGFNVLGQAALSAARDRGRACLLAFLDVDGLKRVNDEEGHDAGDALIADVARTLRSALGPADVLARTGGDEFCVLVTETDECSETFKSRLLESFVALNESADRRYSLSVSVGLVRVGADDLKTLQVLVAEADELMYADKKAKPHPRIAV
ncbi:sensor domain-containing diguanylate cyclase [Mycobacterium sp. NPDC006124]|uniref:sensor domain-containing diguanylate cyclase n=1 Tax=Mycobacterium sp. NPDC006124 TaxID=3156729 RepID=UPI0033B663E3